MLQLRRSFSSFCSARGIGHKADSLTSHVRSSLQAAVAQTLAELHVLPTSYLLSTMPALQTDAPSKQNGFSDYQSAAALGLFRRVKALSQESLPDARSCHPPSTKEDTSLVSLRSPRDLAARIASHVKEADSAHLIESVSIAGAGYLNIQLRETGLASILAANTHLQPPAPATPPLRVAVDLSSPNIAKEMHVGHLRSTIIGDALCRVMDFVGLRVSRINHVGDWGTQFGMLISHLRDMDNNPAAEATLADLSSFYKQAKARFDEEPGFQERARREVVALQGGDEDSLRAWRQICDTSRCALNRIYDRLGVDLEEIGESTYNEQLPGIAQDLLDRGVAEMHNGMVAVFVEGHDAPLIVRKSDGGYTYDTTDLAAARQRARDHDWLVYVVDNGQSSHFEKVFRVAAKAGYIPSASMATHVPFGLVLGADRKRFKSRSGASVRLVDLLDEAQRRSQEVLADRIGDAATLHSAAEQIGMSAVKYFDLSKNRVQDYAFSYDAMLEPKGNTAVYLLYSAARMQSLLHKGGAHTPSLVTDMGFDVHANAEERALAMHCLLFPDAVQETLHQLQPHLLCQYTFHLCEHFNTFYASSPRIVDSPARLALVGHAHRTLRTCLGLLNLATTVEVM